MVVFHVLRDIWFRTTFRRRRPVAVETMLAPRGLQQRHRAARTLQRLLRSPQGIRCLLFYPRGAFDLWNTRDVGMYPFTSHINDSMLLDNFLVAFFARVHFRQIRAILR